MCEPMTASEVRDRIEQWERREAPKLQASVEAILASVLNKWVDGVLRHWLDRELQQQRMTDDGCPLG